MHRMILFLATSKESRSALSCSCIVFRTPISAQQISCFDVPAWLDVFSSSFKQINDDDDYGDYDKFLKLILYWQFPYISTIFQFNGVFRLNFVQIRFVTRQNVDRRCWADPCSNACSLHLPLQSVNHNNTMINIANCRPHIRFIDKKCWNQWKIGKKHIHDFL